MRPRNEVSRLGYGGGDGRLDLARIDSLAAGHAHPDAGAEHLAAIGARNRFSGKGRLGASSAGVIARGHAISRCELDYLGFITHWFVAARKLSVGYVPQGFVV